MLHTQAESVESGAGVSLDHASLRGQAAGGDTRYTVALRGPADQTWADTYLSVQGASAPHRRFQLDRPTRRVTFSCPSVEGPAYVFEMLERLESLLELVERRLAYERARALPAATPVLRTIA